MLTIENAVSFLVGILVVYVMFRAMGVFVVILCCSMAISGFAHSLYFFNSTTNMDWGYATLAVGVTAIPMTDDAMDNDTMLYYFVQNYGIDDKSDWAYYPSEDLACRYYPSQTNYWPAVAAGMAFGLTVCGFGWKLRMVRKTTGDF